MFAIFKNDSGSYMLQWEGLPHYASIPLYQDGAVASPGFSSTILIRFLTIHDKADDFYCRVTLEAL